MEFSIASLVTPGFRFEAVASTEEEALGLLEQAWSQHFEEMNRPADMLPFDTLVAAAQDPASPFSLSTRRMQLGQAYRDGVRLSPP